MGPSPFSVVFACKTGTFGPEQQVSMCSRHNLSLCVCKTAWLEPELLVSMGPSPHLWILHAKQWLFHQNYSLYGSQTSPIVLCMQNIVICTRMTSQYGFQTSSVVLSKHNSVLSTRIKRLYWFQSSSVVLCMKNSAKRTRITSLFGSKTPPVVFPCKTATFGPE